MIVARSFGKCPGCYRDLPDELQLSSKEKELDEKGRGSVAFGQNFDVGGGGGDFGVSGLL